MFLKKKEAATLVIPKISEPRNDQRSNIQELNHEFFLLVRDQKYEQALAIGSLYLKYHPENQSVKKFCDFIVGNKQELIKMVNEEQIYTDESSDDQESEQDSEDQEDKESVCSSISSKSSAKSSVSSKSVKSLLSNSSKASFKKEVVRKGKQNSEICKIHKWQHICKQKNCPNKK